MAKEPLKRKNTQKPSESSFSSLLFKVLLLCINFFISIGEGTRVIFTSPVRFLKVVLASFSSFKKQFSSRQKLKEKTQRSKRDVVASPVAATMAEKRKKKVLFAQFKVPQFRFPQFHLFASKAKRPQTTPLKLKRQSKIKVEKRRTSGKKFTTFLGFLGSRVLKYLNLALKAILSLLIIVLVTLFKGFLVVLKFLVLLIKKPFEFLNTLLTAQLRFFLLGVLICGIFFVTSQLHQFVISLPSPKEIGKINYSLATHLTDRNGKLLYEIYRDEKRTPIEISQLPKYVTQASVAIEDKDFYNHKGVSLVSGILRAARETLFQGSLQGGSTITQQLVKTALLTPERTVTRKVKEIILALWAEQMYTKEQILQMYMNQVPYGGAAYGIQEAAKTYFGKDAKDLTITEAALLAGLPQAPSDYSPFVNPKVAVERRNDVLQKMKEQNYITDSQYKAAYSTPLEIIKPETAIKAPHFVFYVKSQLENEYGTRMVEEGGLNVTTTLDLDVQDNVEKILKDELSKQSYLNVSNGAVLVIKPSTGEIIAMAGSVDYFQEPFGAFNVTTAERQPGSSLKPLLYSLALQKGATAATIYADAPTRFVMPGADPYSPINYDGRFHGNVTMRTALANSYNLPAVKALYNVGIQSFVTYMQSLGITTWTDPGRYVLPMALGGVEIKMVDEATAYGSLANYGKRTDLTGILKLQDSNENTLSTLKPDSTQVMPEGVAYIITDILSDNQARTATFGPGSQLEIPGYKVAVKTGTTDSKLDNWTFGYTPEYLVAVWIGNNDNTPMNPAIESGATGASSLWHRVMEYMLKNQAKQPTTWYTKPDSVVEKSCGGKNELFLVGTEGTVNCNPPTPTRSTSISPTPATLKAPQAKNQNGAAQNTLQGEALNVDNGQKRNKYKTR